MKLSIIVPIYNSEKTISNCIHSILNQTFKDLEIICINDGSTDNTGSILSKLKELDSRIKIIDQPNMGVATARNKGLKSASGDYIGFVDSDDRVSEDMFQKMVETIEQNQSDLVMCGSKLIDVSGKKFNLNDTQVINPNLESVLVVTKENMNSINVFLWNKLFRKNLIIERSISFPDGMWYEDSAFVWCYMTAAKTMNYIPEQLYHYHRISTSIMGQTHSKNYSRAMDHLRICRFVSTYLRSQQDLHKNFLKPFIEFCLSNFIGSLIYAPVRYKLVCVLELFSILKDHGKGSVLGFGQLLMKKLAKRVSRMI